MRESGELTSPSSKISISKLNSPRRSMRCWETVPPKAKPPWTRPENSKLTTGNWVQKSSHPKPRDLELQGGLCREILRRKVSGQKLRIGRGCNHGCVVS